MMGLAIYCATIALTVWGLVHFGYPRKVPNLSGVNTMPAAAETSRPGSAGSVSGGHIP